MTEKVQLNSNKPVVKREKTPSRSEETSSADKLLQEILLGDKTSTAKTKTPKKDKKEIDKILDEYIKMGFDLDNVYNLNEIMKKYPHIEYEDISDFRYRKINEKEENAEVSSKQKSIDVES